MIKELNTISSFYFQEADFNNLTKEQTANFIETHPYSVVARILHLRKLHHGSIKQEMTNELFTASLYLNNPLPLKNHITSSSSGIPETFSDENLITDGVVYANENLSVTGKYEFETQDNDSVNGNEQSEIEATTKVADIEEITPSPFYKETIEPFITSESQQISEKQVQESKELSEEGVDKDLKPNPHTFEPFFTIDYFASQGIRLKQSELGKDKLGQQLRSFTDWLRSMKRLPDSQSTVDDASQQTISIFAAHSLQEKEVITEAMAEVWAKQGNREKAIAIYEKLSLQNPSKSPYFAAKIDQLNPK